MKILVVGSGTMGAGIAQSCVQSGYEVVLNDIDMARLETAQTNIVKFVRRGAEKGQFSIDEGEAAIRRLTISADLEQAATDVDWVIEAIYENTAAKQELLRRLEVACPNDTHFGSNTSGLSISELATVLQRPSRLVGLHFFNPVPLMKLVEVVRGAATDVAVLEEAVGVVRQLNKTPIVCDDSPNFVVNRINRPIYYEAQLLVSEGVTAQNIDKAMQLGANFRLGPLATGDMSGLEIGLAVSENIFRELGDLRYRPTALVKMLVKANRLGRKTGRGFYHYPTGTTEPQPTQPDIALPTAILPRKLAVTGQNIEANRLRGKLQQAGFTIVAASQIQEAEVVFVPPDDIQPYRSYFVKVTQAARPNAVLAMMEPLASVTEMGALSKRAAFTVGYHCPISFLNDKFYEVALGLDTDLQNAATLVAILNQQHYNYVVSPETPAGIVRREICCLVNEAAFCLQEGLASVEDIDLALTLGMNYGLGPFQYGDRLGLDIVLNTMEYLQSETGDPRYRPAPLLRRYVRAGRLGQEAGQGFYSL